MRNKVIAFLTAFLNLYQVYDKMKLVYILLYEQSKAAPSEETRKKVLQNC